MPHVGQDRRLDSGLFVLVFELDVVLAQVLLDFPADPLTHVASSNLALADRFFVERRVRPAREDLLKLSRDECAGSGTHASIKTRMKGGPLIDGSLLELSRTVAGTSGKLASSSRRWIWRSCTVALISSYWFRSVSVSCIEIGSVSHSQRLGSRALARSSGHPAETPTHLVPRFQFRLLGLNVGLHGLQPEPLGLGLFGGLTGAAGTALSELRRERLLVGEQTLKERIRVAEQAVGKTYNLSV